jgi:hypothetical protein
MNGTDIMKEKEREKEKDMMAFRAPLTFLKTIQDTAEHLEVSHSELVRRAIEKGIAGAVDEIQAEKTKAAKDLVKKLKGKPNLNFDHPHMFGAMSLCAS